jgi:HK97 gp10 family phage protein
MTTRATLTTKGVAETLDALAQAGQDVDATVDRMLQAGGGVLLDGMKTRVPKDTHNLESKLALDGPHQDGNLHYVQVGMEPGIDADTARYGNAQEYGTSVMAAQPYVRPTVDNDLGKARRAMIEEASR